MQTFLVLKRQPIHARHVEWEPLNHNALLMTCY